MSNLKNLSDVKGVLDSLNNDLALIQGEIKALKEQLKENYGVDYENVSKELDFLSNEIENNREKFQENLKKANQILSELSESSNILEGV